MDINNKYLALAKGVGVLVVSASAGTLVKNAVRNNLDYPDTRKQKLTEKAGLFGIGVVVSGIVASTLNTEIAEYSSIISDLKEAWDEGTKNVESEVVDDRKI